MIGLLQPNMNIDSVNVALHPTKRQNQIKSSFPAYTKFTYYRKTQDYFHI